MKFLLCEEIALKEHVDAIANGLLANQCEVSIFNKDVYRAYDESNPDYLILTPQSASHPEIQDFCKNRRPKCLLVTPEKILISNGNTINLPSFASTLKYKPQLFSKEFECDVALCFDGNYPDKIHALYYRLYHSYRVKIIGAFINCPGYIGVGSPTDLVKLSKSAKLTISNNKIITNSLLYNNVCAINHDGDIDTLLKLDISDLEEIIINEKKNIVTEIKVGKIIREELSHSN